jgi:hypothetical protein
MLVFSRLHTWSVVSGAYIINSNFLDFGLRLGNRAYSVCCPGSPACQLRIVRLLSFHNHRMQFLYLSIYSPIHPYTYLCIYLSNHLSVSYFFGEQTNTELHVLGLMDTHALPSTPLPLPTPTPTFPIPRIFLRVVEIWLPWL